MLTTGKDPSLFLFLMFVLNIYSKYMDFNTYDVNDFIKSMCSCFSKMWHTFCYRKKILTILTKDMLTIGKDPSPFLFLMFVLNIYSKYMDFIACWERVFVVCLPYYWCQVVVDNPMIYYFGMSSYITSVLAICTTKRSGSYQWSEINIPNIDRAS